MEAIVESMCCMEFHRGNKVSTIKPPVDQGERIAELLDALEMGGVAGHQLQAVMQGDGGDHRIGRADGLADAFQLARDAAGQLGGGLVEREDFFGGDGGEEVLQAAELCFFWKPRTISMTVMAESV